MDDKTLISIGLTQNQARTYRALIIKKSLKPAQLMKLIGESRTNCYALLDKLVELGLANKIDENKKFTYYPASPLALKSLLEKQQKETETKLAELDRKMPQMMSAYQLGGDAPKIKHYKGKKELEQMYYDHLAEPSQELYFIRPKADVPYFGLSKMSDIRRASTNYNKKRFGITPIVFYSVHNRKKDARAGSLKRAWIKNTEYNSPVEWAVCGDKIQITTMDGEGYGVMIDHPEIAKSMQEILSLLFKYIKQNPDYDQIVKESKFDVISNE